MQFLYDLPDGGVFNTPYYSGRLSAVKWMTKDGNGNNSNERSYAYTYDNLDRLTASSYAERIGSTGGFGTNVSAYDESGITYDENGNIQTLNRNSVVSGSIAQVDKLQYTYAASNPDSLINMADGLTANYTNVGFRNLTGSTANYAYDLNGNLTTDPYKGLTLAYDVLNKTDKITVNTSTNRWIDYTYDGSGSVIRKRVYDNNMLQTTTDYIDGFVYTNSTLAYFPMPEGRVVNNAGTLTPEYIITDMQGNARISFNNTGTGGTAKVVQENSYSGFGLVLANSAVSGGSNKNLYNGGSEWQNDYSNLPDYYQTFYRNYDAEIGRFISTDPEPESSESMTPYQYAGNDPVMMNDPMGNKQLPKETPPAPTPEQVVFANNGYNSTPPDLIPVWDDGNGQDYLNYTEEQWESGDWYKANNGDVAAINRLYGGATSVNRGDPGFNSLLSDLYPNSTDLAVAAFNDDDRALNESLGSSSIHASNTEGLLSPTFQIFKEDNRLGALITVHFDISNYMGLFKSYSFISLVTSIPLYTGYTGVPEPNPVVDGTQNPDDDTYINPPFYNNSYDPEGPVFGNIVQFYDRPSNRYPDYNTNYTFSAETTLVGIGYDNQVYPLTSFSWGYTLFHNQVTLTGSTTNFHSPSQNTLNVILEYNLSAH